MSSEFDIIKQLQLAQSVDRAELVLGIGDDAAVLDIPKGKQLVISTDTLNAGVHFPVDTSPQDIGFKSLAVNLSDMAAMGAEPFAVNLSLAMPADEHEWLAGFTEGFLSLASQHNVQLAGGDTTRGPLSISVTMLGLVSPGEVLRRDTAKPGDSIYVTGTLGDAGAALLGLMGELKLNGPQQQQLYARLNRPQARVELGQALTGIASACIDLSDGLAADVGHLVESGELGATLYVDQLPLSEHYREVFDLAGGWSLPLYAGDDYELCFTVADANLGRLQALDNGFNIPLTCVGMIDASPGVKLMMPDGTTTLAESKGYDHFRS